MQRPGQKITRKTIMMHKKMKDLDRKDISSKSLLVNVMDMDDDFRWDSNVFVLHGLSIWRQGYRVEVEIQCPPDPSSNIKLFKLGRLPSKNCNWRIFYSHGCCVLFEWFAREGGILKVWIHKGGAISVTWVLSHSYTELWSLRFLQTSRVSNIFQPLPR